MELLRTICNTPGVSGFEGEIREIVKRELETCSDEIRIDRLGNLIALKKTEASPESTPLKVMIAAHMDEIGFMVKHIDADGFIRFLPLGGYDPRTLLSEQIVIHGKELVKGIITPQPNWILKDDEKQKVLSQYRKSHPSSFLSASCSHCFLRCSNCFRDCFADRV